MSFVYLTKATLGIFARRVSRLSGASARQWGSMTIGDMLEHLIQTLRVSLGEIHVEDQSTPLTRSVAGYVIFRWVPWPKGRLKTFKSMLPAPQGGVEEQKMRLQAAVERFVEALECDSDRKTVSPLLGPTTLRRWSLVHGRHMDHHLTQFGA